jgi:hypothetical protein
MKDLHPLFCGIYQISSCLFFYNLDALKNLPDNCPGHAGPETHFEPISFVPIRFLSAMFCRRYDLTEKMLDGQKIHSYLLHPIGEGCVL